MKPIDIGESLNFHIADKGDVCVFGCIRSSRHRTNLKITGHIGILDREIFDFSLGGVSEKADIAFCRHIDIEIADGVSLAVKGSLEDGIYITDRGPFLVLKIDIGGQLHSLVFERELLCVVLFELIDCIAKQFELFKRPDLIFSGTVLHQCCGAVRIDAVFKSDFHLSHYPFVIVLSYFVMFIKNRKTATLKHELCRLPVFP